MTEYQVVWGLVLIGLALGLRWFAIVPEPVACECCCCRCQCQRGQE